MAEPAVAQQPEVEVAIRAALAPLERDLQSARQTLERFDRAINPSNLNSLTQAGQKGTVAFSGFERQLNSSQRAQTNFSNVTESTTDAVNRQGNALSSVTQKQQEFTKAANDNTRAANDNTRSITASGKGFIESASEVFKWVGYIKLASAVLVASNPAVKRFMDTITGAGGGAAQKAGEAITKTGQAISGLSGSLGAIGPAADKTGRAISGIVPAVSSVTRTISPFMKILDGLEIVQLGSHFVQAGAGAQVLGAAAVSLSPALRKVAAHEVTEGIKALGPAFGTAAGAARTASSFFGEALLSGLAFASKIVVPVTLAVAGFKLLTAAFEESQEKVEKLTATYKKVQTTGFSIEFFDRQAKAASELHLNVDGVTNSLQKFTDLMKPTGEATALDTQLESIKNNASLTTPEKYRAFNQLITDALDKGMRLAGLNLAEKVYGPDVVARLALNTNYLKEMQEATDKIAAKRLINPADAQLAKELDERMRLVKEGLGEAFVDFTHLGLVLRNAWTTTLEGILKVTTFVTNVFDKLRDTKIGIDLTPIKTAADAVGTAIAGWTEKLGKFVLSIPGAAAAVRLIARAATPGVSTSGGAVTGEGTSNTAVSGTPPVVANSISQEFNAVTQLNDAFTKLSRSMRDHISVEQAAGNTIGLQTSIYGDTSNAAKTYKDTIESLDKQTDKTFKSQKDLDEAIKAIDKSVSNASKAFYSLQNVGEVGVGKALPADAIEKLKKLRDETVKSFSIQQQAKDEWDRATESVSRHIAAQEADAAAVGKSVGEHAKLRTELQLKEAATRAGVLDEKTEEIKRLGDRAAEAAQKLGVLKLQDDLVFERQQLRRDPQEAAVAEKLRNIYGTNNYQSQMNGALAAQARFNEQLKATKAITDEFATSVGSNLTTALADIATGAKKASEAFKNLSTSVIRSLTEMIIKLTITEPIVRSLKAGLSGLTSFITPGAAPGAPLNIVPAGASAKGNVFNFGNIVPFALGGILNGIVNRPTLFKMAGGAGLMGEAGPEGILPLSRGRGGKLGVNAEGLGGPPIMVNVYNPEGVRSKVQQRKNAGGGIDLDIIGEHLEAKMANGVLRGDSTLANAQRTRFGLNPGVGNPKR